MNRIYVLLRHGESQANVEGRIASRFGENCADPDLTERGRAQVRFSVPPFLEMLRKPVVAVVSSPFRRTRSTADILCNILGRDYSVDSRLRERDFGLFDGGPDSSYSTVWASDAAETSTDEFRVEALASVARRIDSLVRELDRAGKDDCVFLVAHGDVCSIALAYYAGRPLSEHRSFAMENAECRQIAFAPNAASRPWRD